MIPILAQGAVAIHPGDPSGHPLPYLGLFTLPPIHSHHQDPSRPSTPEEAYPDSARVHAPTSSRVLSHTPNTRHLEYDLWTGCLGANGKRWGCSDPTPNPHFSKTQVTPVHRTLCNLLHLLTLSHGSRAVCLAALCLFGEIMSGILVCPNHWRLSKLHAGTRPDNLGSLPHRDHMVTPVDWQPDHRQYLKDPVTSEAPLSLAFVWVPEDFGALQGGS